MPYAVDFVRKEPGQPWAEALAAAHDLGSGEPLPGEVADRLTARARDVVGEVAAAEVAGVLEILTPDGIVVRVAGDRAELRVEEGPRGDEALRAMRHAHTLARAVEEETGLRGWDPQLGEPVVDDPVLPGRVAPHPVAEGDDLPRATAPSGGAFVPPTSLAPERPRRRPWWRFWSRG